MRKPNDAVEQFVALRSALLSEREVIVKRLEQIDAALGSSSGLAAAGPRLGRPPGRRGRRASNSMNIREAIAKVTARKALGVREIVDEVQKIGYKFSSSNPVNSVGAYLYGAHGKK